MIHETAIIEPSAKLGKNVRVGPWSYIGHEVEIGDDTIVESHVVIKGPTRIGQGNRFFQFSSIGEDCQDKKYNGERTELQIGDRNHFREGVTVHRGTAQDNCITIIGSDNLFMANAHIAHDCVLGDNNVLANTVTLAGHVHMGSHCILGGFAGVHQFCHVGSYSFCGAGSIVIQDVPPYVMCAGDVASKAVPKGINKEGLRRHGMNKETIRAIFNAYKAVYRQNLTIEEAIRTIQENVETFPEVQHFVEFLQQSPRGIIR